MESQPTTAKGKQVLSDIEQSIQNALALFNSKDLGGGINPLYIIDDPIVSLHDPEKQNTVKDSEFLNSCKLEIPKTNPPPMTDTDTEGNQQFYDALPFTNIKMSEESIALPFLDNPIKNTIEEMQRVLNAKSDIPSSLIQPQSQQQPSPEELLNLYSQGLGITLSPNPTPRGDFDRNFNESDFSKANQIKKEKKNPKKPKQQKTNKEKKTEIKKGKLGKSEMVTNHDIKMRELMNIYGCGEKMKKLKSDSTIGSKSEVSRKASMKKLSNVNNVSSKASSIAVSRKSKKLKYKFTNDLDINFNDGDLVPLEKSSRLSTKRKMKQKNSNIKPIKKPNLKRKLGTKSSNDDLELKLSKNYQTSTRNRNYETYKSKNIPRYVGGNNNYSQKKQTKQKPANHKQKDYFNCGKVLNVSDSVEYSKSDNLTTLDAVPNIKEQNSTKNKSIFSDIPSEKLASFLSKQSLVIDAEKNQNTLNKKLSEERKLNKQVSLKDNIHYHTYKDQNKELSNDDNGNEDMMESTQFHYTLPTQSSRSKEVDRFLNGHYQHLPFVIGQSTNKSHNLWVNIQEALSLIKQNIPQTVEIQSLHDKDSERPLSVLSKLTIKSSKKPHQCPALMNDGLYDIPETTNEGEEGIKSWEDHPDCIQANLDPNFSRPRCSCLPQATLSYKKVLRQIFGGGEDSMELNRARDEIVDHGGDSYTAELRKVLITFTQEFEDLNNKYEKMLSDPNSSKEELEQLEMYLETKEEEIREIIARINEVKELNERSHMETHSRGGTSLEQYKSTTSIQLMQTLRRVQQLKEDLQSRPSVRHLSRINCAKSLY